MEVKELKEYIAEDTDRIRDVLESVGMHDIWESNQNEMRCALPDHENKSSVAVRIDPELFTSIFSLDFNGDLIGAIELVKGCDFKSAISFIHSVLGIQNKYGVKRVDPLRLLKRFVSGKPLSDPKPNKLYDANIIDKYIMLPHKDILEEGISPNISNMFNIGYDPEKSRIIFPHYDWKNPDKIVGIKGRSTMNSAELELLGIPKYWNYINGYQKTQNLYGWNLAKDEVSKTRLLLLFEGEKSVLKQFTFEKGAGYSVALGGHTISEEQITFILKNTPIDCEIVLCFDHDVMVQDTFIQEQLRRFQPFRKCSYIYDKFGLLDEKDAPVDKGYKIWNYLLKYRLESPSHQHVNKR